MRRELTPVPRPFRRAEARWIFSARCSGHPGRDEKIRRLYRRLAEALPTLFLIRDREDWRLGARPGLDTLCCPRLPRLERKAIASAAGVLSARPEPLVMAQEAGVPAMSVAWTEAEEKSARRRGFRALRLDRLSVDAALARFQAHVASSPSAIRDRETACGETLAFCCMADLAYIPFFLGLLENLREAHAGPLSVHFLALDDGAAKVAAETLAEPELFLYRPGDLWSEPEQRRLAERTRADQAYTSKSRLLARALARAGRPIFYFDLDLYFFRSPAHLNAELEGAEVLLFPHWNRSLAHSRLHGLFNAGMIGVAPGAERFLAWWTDLCLFKCAKQVSQGFFDDQGFLDLAPLYFERVHVYKGCDENVAFWNMPSLGVRVPAGHPEEPLLLNGRRVGSLHAAQADDRGLFEIKAAWDQLVVFFSSHYFLRKGRPVADAFFLSTLKQQKGHFPALHRLFSAHHTLHSRLHMRPLAITPYGTTFFVSGAGKHLLAAGASLYRLLRTPKRFLELRMRSPVKALPTDFWVHLQQRELYRSRGGE